MTTRYIVFIISFCIGAFVPIFVRWIHDEMHKAKKPKKSTITPVFAKSELKMTKSELQMNVVRTAIQRDRLRLDNSDQVYEYAAKKLLRQIASIIKEQLMDNIEVKNDEPTNCMILEFTFWTRKPRQKVRTRNDS